MRRRSFRGYGGLGTPVLGRVDPFQRLHFRRRGWDTVQRRRRWQVVSDYLEGPLPPPCSFPRGSTRLGPVEDVDVRQAAGQASTFPALACPINVVHPERTRLNQHGLSLLSRLHQIRLLSRPPRALSSARIACIMSGPHAEKGVSCPRAPYSFAPATLGKSSAFLPIAVHRNSRIGTVSPLANRFQDLTIRANLSIKPSRVAAGIPRNRRSRS